MRRSTRRFILEAAAFILLGISYGALIAWGI